MPTWTSWLYRSVYLIWSLTSELYAAENKFMTFFQDGVIYRNACCFSIHYCTSTSECWIVISASLCWSVFSGPPGGMIGAEDKGLQSYEISPFRDSEDEDSEEEEKRSQKPIPQWARYVHCDCLPSIQLSNSLHYHFVCLGHEELNNLPCFCVQKRKYVIATRETAWAGSRWHFCRGKLMQSWWRYVLWLLSAL